MKEFEPGAGGGAGAPQGGPGSREDNDRLRAQVLALEQRLQAREAAYAELAAQHQTLQATVAELRQEEVRGHRAQRAQEEVIYIASHDLRNPLNTLQLALATLFRADQAELPAPRRADLLRTCERQVRRMTRLLSALLVYSRITGGRLEMMLEEVDLARLAREVAGRWGDEAEGRLSVNADTGLVGRWDKARLELVLDQLLQNAIKHGDGKPVTVRVSRAAGAGGAGGTALLTVSDQGRGMSREEQERLLSGSGDVARREHGPGLGLFVVRHILGALKGSLRIDSQLGQGARFIVELPLD